ncbi:cytochrome c biogenesis heme-transporting ATPase CcmA [Parashewanella tropica]|uniref:cytochrome c biogenesis heme-transporting ATPase CcmA n=1 Tax=Parashewanella tropica TaxID=2547970 RepID=UPI001FE7E681|nr:cytochrome c biogenesis heme-transporting ATPase CcmA [Parashewanella tropica]
MSQPVSTNVLLTADSLTCIREERVLFDELSFSVNAGDIVQIEGPNGAGKTSLLRILTGLSRPYEGQVLYQNQPIAQASEEFLQALLYLGHKAGVKPELTAQANLDVYLTLNGYEKANLREILAEVNLSGFEDTPAGHLSAGQHRRTSLARLWHTNAKIWILDEPFTAIDKRGVEHLENKFLQHADQGGCVILTSHQDLTVIPAERLKVIRLDAQEY